jgi:hypothetical protein
LLHLYMPDQQYMPFLITRKLIFLKKKKTYRLVQMSKFTVQFVLIQNPVSEIMKELLNA